jgi:sugar lactone lactonase YvrE
MRDLECLVKARFGVGESPVWDSASNRLLWSDNTTDEVHAIDLADRRQRSWHFGGLIGSLGLTRSGPLDRRARQPRPPVRPGDRNE